MQNLENNKPNNSYLKVEGLGNKEYQKIVNKIWSEINILPFGMVKIEGFMDSYLDGYVENCEDYCDDCDDCIECDTCIENKINGNKCNHDIPYSPMMGVDQKEKVKGDELCVCNRYFTDWDFDLENEDEKDSLQDHLTDTYSYLIEKVEITFTDEQLQTLKILNPNFKNEYLIYNFSENVNWEKEKK